MQQQLENPTEKQEKDDVQKMAEFTEHVLSNSVVKRMLRFCTKKCRCGRRIDLILKDYSGDKQKLCTRCKIAKFMILQVLTSFARRSKISEKDVKLALKDNIWRKGLCTVLEGLAVYGPKKPFTSYAPFLIVWNITKKCNLACKHCYENAHIPDKDELTTEEALQAVDKMADAGVAYIAISGGEPLSRPDFFQVAKHIIDREMGFSIATNATLMTKETAKKLKEMGCSYAQISLDGAKAETHDSFRGRNVFTKTLEGIKNAVDEGIIIGLAMTVTKFNLDEVPDVIDLAEKLGVAIFMHYNFIPVGRGTEIIDMDLTPQERETLLKYLSSQVGKRKVAILSTAPQFAPICAQQGCPAASMTHFDTIGQMPEFGSSVQFLAEFVGGCGTGRLYCALEPNGDIEPCVFIPIIVGNIKKDDLVDVWQKNETLKKLRDRENFKGRCSACENRNICGGCRARAYGYYKDVQQSDPGCILNVDEWEKLKAVAKK
ncbi:MAG: radical SAM protein [Candidatus Aenigmarchaeota archaeon]|nr:radical SAM protein [Candidatus Aenigmarchaeota archaeon]